MKGRAMPLQSQEFPACSSSGNGCACKGQPAPETATPVRQAAVASSKRGFLQDLIAVAASFGLASTARAALPGDPSFQPERRPGMEGKRFGMLVDMRKCIGCQACTVSCSVENQPPLASSAPPCCSTRWTSPITPCPPWSVCRACAITAMSLLRARVPGAGHLPAHRRHCAGR